MTVADRDALPCGCRWRRDEQHGDVIDQCAEHRAETGRTLRALDGAAASAFEREALRGLDSEVSAAVGRRGRR